MNRPERTSPLRSRIALLAGLAVLNAAPATAEAARFTIEARAADVLGEDAGALERAGLGAGDMIVWDVHAPPASDMGPPGLLVFISPLPTCMLPDGWDDVLDARNLIWICARRSGNAAPVPRRIATAAAARAALGREIDADRVYLSGFSGGGRVASMLITEAPLLFGGAIYFSGVNFWTTKDDALIRQIRERRYVFVTGRADFNWRDTRTVARKYRNAGAVHVRLLDLPGLKHELPPAEDFARALAYLDDRKAPGEDTQ